MVAGAATAASARAQTCMTLRYDFQPDCYHAAGDPACLRSVDRLDLGPQIAVWVESADRTVFVDTLMVTNMTAARGIGNRPGVSNFLSGPLFPYGKRSMALPIWAHARGKLYDTVVMQDGRETWLGFHESLSSGEPYYCRPLRAQEINVDAITCPTRFTSAKGKLDASTTSYYPPRNDLTTFSNGDCDVLGGVYPGCAASATSYATLNDLDAVAAATPPYGARYTGTWTIPTTLPAGDYALLVEVNKEFDNNAAHTHLSYTDPQLSGYGLTNNFGQPSVVYRVPIHIDLGAGVAAAATTTQIAGYSDWTGLSGAINGRDATISTADPGSGEGRLLEISTAAGTGRVHVQVQPCGSTTACTPPPPAPGTVSEVAAVKDGLTDTSAVVTFKNAGSDGGGAVASYEIRYREGDSMTDQEFVEAIRAPQVAPGAPGSTATLTLTGLKPATDYVVGVRAVDTCGQTSLLSQVGFATPATAFKQIEGCFVATAAWGSALATQVEALRRARDHARSGNAMAAVAVDLYYRSGPPAAAVLRRSDTARAAVRMLLSPAAGTAALLF
jgi:Fibronectin type III domain